MGVTSLGVQYVHLDGSDSNDGESWGSAKRTITAARSVLANAAGIAEGIIRVGHGNFQAGETFPILVNKDFHIICSGPGFGGATARVGTQISLPDGADVNVFEPHPDSNYLQNCTLSNVLINGRKNSQTTQTHGLVTRNGGANFRVDNVLFYKCGGTGWKHTGNALNVVGRDLFFQKCGAAIDFERSSGAGWTVDLSGNLQVDACGPQAIRFVDVSSSVVYDLAQIRIGALKSEANIDADHHNPLIFLESASPRATGFNLLIHSVNATRSPQFDPPSGMTLIREAPGPGRPSRVTIQQAAARGWNQIFASDATGVVAAGASTGNHQLELHGFFGGP